MIEAASAPEGASNDAGRVVDSVYNRCICFAPFSGNMWGEVIGRKISRRDAVVLVILGVVALLLFVWPLLRSYESNRHNPSDFYCRNNLRQIGIIIECFRQDHNSRYMRAAADADLPDEGFTVGAATEVFDSSLTLALLHPRYIEQEVDLFECPSTEHRVAFTKDKSTGGSDNIDADGDWEFGNSRFLSDASTDCDPDYLIDPRIPTQAAAARIIMADGPDLQHERFWKQPWALDPTQFNAKEVSNHPNRVIVLRVDYSVGHLDINRRTGKVANKVCEGAFSYDEDIYDDDDMQVAGAYQGDEKVDCNLGNYRFYTPDAKDAPGLTGVTPRGLWHPGPDWDQAPPPKASRWWQF
jgi:hypothetical protein